MAAKLMNSSDESSMGSAVYFSNSVLTENLHVAEKDTKAKIQTQSLDARNKVIMRID